MATPSLKSVIIFWLGVATFFGIFVGIEIYNVNSRKVPLMPYELCARVTNAWISHNQGYSMPLEWRLLISFDVDGVTCNYLAKPKDWYEAKLGDQYRIRGSKNSRTCFVREALRGCQ